MLDLDKDYATVIAEAQRLRRALIWIMQRVSWQVTTDESAGWLLGGEGIEECLIPDDVLRTLMYLTEEHQ